MHSISIQESMDVCTIEPHSTCQKKEERVIIIIKVRSNRRRFQRNAPKRVWGFGMVWEVEIYYNTAGKYGFPDLLRLTDDIIDISEWVEFEFYDLV